MLDNKEETQRQQGIKIFAQMLNITEIPSIYNEPIPFNKLDTNANFECVGDITLDTKYLSQDIFSFMNEWTYIQDKYRLAVRAWGIKSSKKNKTKKHKRFVRKSKNTQKQLPYEKLLTHKKQKYYRKHYKKSNKKSNKKLNKKSNKKSNKTPLEILRKKINKN